MRLIYRVVFATIYVIGCAYFAVGLLGGGHGTLLFAIPLLTLPAFVVAGLIVGPNTKAWARYLAVGLVAFHNLVTIVVAYLVESGNNFAHTFKALEFSSGAFILASLWYFAGQLTFWFLLFRTTSRQPPSTLL